MSSKEHLSDYLQSERTSVLGHMTMLGCVDPLWAFSPPSETTAEHALETNGALLIYVQQRWLIKLQRNLAHISCHIDTARISTDGLARKMTAASLTTHSHGCCCCCRGDQAAVLCTLRPLDRLSSTRGARAEHRGVFPIQPGEMTGETGQVASSCSLQNRRLSAEPV
ncbi:hypothetical protein AOLI_G00145070 [Acnodon oligacanthus]